MFAEQIEFMNIPETRKNDRTVQRLRERFDAEGTLNGYNDEDILTHLIGFINSTESAPVIARRLLDGFGSLKGVLEARPEQLRRIAGVSGRMASLIATAQEMVKVWNRCASEISDRIGNIREAEKYCMSLLAGERVENFWVIALNARCHVLGRRRVSEGSLSEVSGYPRIVMETALNYNAHSVLLTHNHPGGTCGPSPEDIASTVQLQALLGGVGILVLDHIIIAGNGSYSMIEQGDIDYRTRK